MMDPRQMSLQTQALLLQTYGQFVTDSSWPPIFYVGQKRLIRHGLMKLINCIYTTILFSLYFLQYSYERKVITLDEEKTENGNTWYVGLR